ncbi:MAG TPA: hypothetical protein VF381_07915 [Thermoanaerobaculia bacterium]
MKVVWSPLAMDRAVEEASFIALVSIGDEVVRIHTVRRFKRRLAVGELTEPAG